MASQRDSCTQADEGKHLGSCSYAGQRKTPSSFPIDRSYRAAKCSDQARKLFVGDLQTLANDPDLHAFGGVKPVAHGDVASLHCHLLFQYRPSNHRLRIPDAAYPHRATVRHITQCCARHQLQALLLQARGMPSYRTSALIRSPSPVRRPGISTMRDGIVDKTSSTQQAPASRPCRRTW